MNLILLSVFLRALRASAFRFIPRVARRRRIG